MSLSVAGRLESRRRGEREEEENVEMKTTNETVEVTGTRLWWVCIMPSSFQFILIAMWAFKQRRVFIRSSF